MSREEYAIEIAWAGGWEEWYQRRGDGFMYSLWKERRLALEKQYRDYWYKEGVKVKGVVTA